MRAAAVLLALLGLGGLPASAHEVGALRAKASFAADGSFRIDAVVDVTHLPEGMSAAAVPQQVQVTFDGVPATLERAALSPSDEKEILGRTLPDGKAVFRLTGRVPPGTRAFGWALPLPVGAYLLGTEEAGEEGTLWYWLKGGNPLSVALLHAPPPPTRAEVVRQYLALGFTHIVPKGLDHILFVLGLWLLSLKPSTILKQVTAFTVAHSITLGLTIYGVVSLSPRIVEPLIALSIVYVTAENLILTEARPWRLGVVFCFGLLHGMGFAGVLRELGLPRSEFLTALLSFNVGVEAGQLAVIAVAYVLVGRWFGKEPWYRRWITLPASAMIGVVGLYWTVQRLLL
jgi:hypothetical protein